MMRVTRRLFAGVAVAAAAGSLSVAPALAASNDPVNVVVGSLLSVSIGSRPQGSSLVGIGISSSPRSVTVSVGVAGVALAVTVGAVPRSVQQPPPPPAVQQPPPPARTPPPVRPPAAPPPPRVQVAAAPAPVAVAGTSTASIQAATPLPLPQASIPTPRPGPGPARKASTTNAQRAFNATVPDPGQVSTDPGVVLVGLLAAGAVVLLIPFPSDLFNRTYAANHDEILGWFRGLGRGLLVSRIQGRGLEHWLAFGDFAVLSGALYSLLNPASRLDAATAAAIVGVASAIALFTTASGISSGLYLTRRMSGATVELRILVSSLPIAALCVVVSRLAHFQPGYLYGLIGAFVVARTPSRPDMGRSVAVSAMVTVALAAAAWLVRPSIAALASGPTPSFAATAADTFLTVLVVLGLEHLVFRLMPIRFMDGARLRAWSTVAWMVLFGVGVFGFLHVLVDPVGGYAHLSDTKRAGMLTAFALFAGFGLFSVLFWGYFRFRPQRAEGSKAA
jgi:hypothetical protein